MSRWSPDGGRVTTLLAHSALRRCADSTSKRPLRASRHRSINAKMHGPRQAVVDLPALGYRLLQLAIRPLAYSSLMTTENIPWMQVLAALIGNKSCHFSPKVGKFLTSFR